MLCASFTESNCMKVIVINLSDSHGVTFATVAGRNRGQACSRAAEYLNEHAHPSPALPIAKLTVDTLHKLVQERVPAFVLLTVTEHTL